MNVQHLKYIVFRMDVWQLQLWKSSYYECCIILSLWMIIDVLEFKSYYII